MPGGRFGIIILALIGLAVYYASNQEVNPFSGKRDFNTVSIDQATKLGAQSYVQMLTQEGGKSHCR
ncbi:MAG: M48 family peptidase, partial [Pseudomonadota bacterium]